MRVPQAPILEKKPAGVAQSLIYSLPIAASLFLVSPLSGIIPGIYAKNFGLSLSAIGFVLLIARLFDAVTDPIVGYVSDQHRKKYGTRKYVIAAGAVCLVAASYFLFIPPDNVSQTYFLVSYCAAFLGFTLIEIPHLAWASELTHDNQQRNRFYGSRAIAVHIGLLLFFAVPLLPFSSNEGFTPEALRWAVFAGALIMAPLLFICLKTLGNGELYSKSRNEPIRQQIDSVIRNAPLLLLLAGFLLSSLGAGLNAGVSFIFADVYLGLGAELPVVYIVGYSIGMLGPVIAGRAARRFEKKTVWAVFVFLYGVSFFFTAFLPPGSQSFVPYTVLYTLYITAYAANIMIVPSLLSDIADYGVWKFGVERRATYFSLYLFAIKAAIGLGGALGMGILGFYGFDPQGSVQGGQAILGLHLAIGYLPAVLMLPAMICILLIPMNTRRHTVIQKRLTARSAGRSQHQQAQGVNASTAG